MFGIFQQKDTFKPLRYLRFLLQYTKSLHVTEFLFSQRPLLFPYFRFCSIFVVSGFIRNKFWFRHGYVQNICMKNAKRENIWSQKNFEPIWGLKIITYCSIPSTCDKHYSTCTLNSSTFQSGKLSNSTLQRMLGPGIEMWFLLLLYSKRYFTKSRTFTISHNWVRRHVLTLEHVQIYELKSQPSEFKIIVFPWVQVQTSLIQLVGLNTEVTFAKSDVGDISSCSDFYNFGPWFDQNWIQLHEWPIGLRIQPNRITIIRTYFII